MYAPLHGHSDYSILDGCGGIRAVCQRAAEVGIEHIALTDHGTMAGIFEFHREAKAAGVHPLLGIEAYICDDRLVYGPPDELKKGLNREEKRALQKKYQKRNHIGLIAKTNTGLKNLYKIASDASVRGYYYKPRTDWDYLAEHSEGIYCLSGCLQGRLCDLIKQEDYSGAEIWMRKMKDVFGNRFLAEIQVNNAAEQKICNRVIVSLASRVGVPLVVTNDYHYCRPESKEPHRMWKYIDYSMGKSKKDIDFCTFEGYRTEGHFVASYDELKGLWIANHGRLDIAVFEKAASNTMLIAESCTAEVDKSNKMVEFPLPDGMNKSDLLRKLVTEGWARRSPYFVGGRTREYKERLQHEINVIKKMGYLDYFFVVQDFIRWAKNQNIPIGPGRGSAAGCLLSWLLGITEIDPIRYNLSFERFLNPYRQKMPDIDVDICKANRDRVIEYLKNKWGEESICAVATYIRMSPKSLFRDVARALGGSFKEFNEVGKLMDSDKSWRENIQTYPEVKQYVEDHPDINIYMDELDGRIRNVGTHAAAFVLTPGKISEYTSLRRIQDKILVEPEGESLEKTGFGKYDLLGLKTLTQINAAAELAGMSWEDLEKVQYDPDYRVFDLYNKGDTVGVFQFWQSKMTYLAQQVKVRSIEDLADCNTMYRPAVLQDKIHERYIHRKHGDEPVEYLHSALVDVLDPTYGVIIYQEQIIKTMASLGLDEGEGDLVRRDMENISKGKVPPSKMNDWIDKCRDRGWGGIPESEALEITEQILHQVGYLFNKSHSVSYSVVGHMCQWLKVHHPREFMLGFLRHEDDLDKIEELVDYFSLNHGIKPSIGNLNTFTRDFELDGDHLRIGLNIAKGLSMSALEQIEQFRPFGSVMDFLLIKNRAFNAKVVTTLARLGMFNGMPLYPDGPIVKNRNQIQAFYETLRNYGRSSPNKWVKEWRDKGEDQWDRPLGRSPFSPKEIWDMFWEDAVAKKPPTFYQKYQIEMEFFEFSVMYNPLNWIGNCADTKKLLALGRPGVKVVPGVITKVRKHIDRNDNEMAFLSVKTKEGLQDVVVFASLWGNMIKGGCILKPGNTGVFYLKPGRGGGYILDKFGDVQPPDDYNPEDYD